MINLESVVKQQVNQLFYNTFVLDSSIIEEYERWKYKLEWFCVEILGIK